MRLEISDQARLDLAELHYYGAEKFGKPAADGYLLELLEAMDRVVEWPESAELHEELDPPMRMLVHRAHNIFYEVGTIEITITRVMHHSANWKKRL